MSNWHKVVQYLPAVMHEAVKAVFAYIRAVTRIIFTAVRVKYRVQCMLVFAVVLPKVLVVFVDFFLVR